MMTRALDILFFFCDQRSEKLCKGWTTAQIFTVVCAALKAGTWLASRDGRGELTGVALGELQGDNMHVELIASTRPGALPAFAVEFQRRYPAITTMSMLRKGRMKLYTMENLNRHYLKG
tara:strand:- start:253 stop:609 length:357 start_codon:yes stop_codon:yes gene_type:complete